MPITQFATTTC